jgi:exocyst complex component 2
VNTTIVELSSRVEPTRTFKMTDYERTILEHYQLSSPYPLEWPAEKDLSDFSEEEEEVKPRAGVRRSKSRYSALERVASDRRSLVPGSQKTGDGVENLVQRDEPDPLGTTESVVRILRQLGLPVADDTRLR